MTHPDWRDLAACRGDLDPTWTAHPSEADPDRVAGCVARCLRDCPVIVDCERWAATEPGFTGIAGGRLWPRGQEDR